MTNNEEAMQKFANELESMRQRAANGGDAAFTDIQLELEEMRESLKDKLSDVGDSVSDSWQKLDRSLQKLEDELRFGSENIKESLDKTLASIKQELPK